MPNPFLEALGFLFMAFTLFAFPVWLIGYFIVNLVQYRRKRLDQLGSAEFREPPAAPISTLTAETGAPARPSPIVEQERIRRKAA